jgi:hypothetical protein
MQRRTLLKTTIAGAVVLTAAGVGVKAVREALPWQHGRLDRRGRAIFSAVAGGVLDGTLSTVPAIRATELQAHLARVESALAQFPPHLQAEVGELLALLATAPGRRWFARLATPWDSAAPAEVQASLQSLRTGNWTLQRQAYHALRDLTNAAYYSEPGTWAHLGYPGPIPV